MALHPPLNVLGICAGVGGLELGLQLAHGYLGKAVRGVLYIEREAAAAASLVASMEAGWLHPAPIWSDARSFDGTSWRGLVDIVTSGDPCQGNSVAGKRLGELDDRWLLDRAIDIFDQTGAPRFFRENVPGNADGQLAVAIPALERLGCRVAVGIFSSAETGNTMRRERLFILAERECHGHSGQHRSLEDRGAPGAAQSEGDQRERLRGVAGGGRVELADCAGLAQPERRVEAWGFPVTGEAGGGWPHDQSGGSSGALGDTAGTRSFPGAFGGIHRGEEGSGPRDAQPQRRGCELDVTKGIGSGEGWSEHAGQQGRSAVASAGGELGRPSSPEPQGQQPGQHHAAGRQVKGGYPVLSGRAVLPPAVIPGPSDSGGWRALLDRYPEYQPALSQEEAESHLRRGIDAMAHRIERLRATGNGVDPVTAAVAYLSLSELLA